MSMGKFTTAGLAAVMVVVAAGRAPGQQLPIRRYGVSDGLAHSGVRCIHQDAKGYVWFGTQEGLSRFDGYHFTNYGTRDGLALSYINTIEEDHRGRLWVGTNGGGVARFLDDPRESQSLWAGGPVDHSKFVNFSIGDSIESNYVDRMLFDAKDTLWCVTDAGLYRGTPGANREPKFEAVASRAVVEHAAAFADSQGRLWFGLGEELIELVHDRIIKYGSAGEFGGHPITGITEDRHGRMLVSASIELFEFIGAEDSEGRGSWKKLPLTLGPGQRIGRSTVDVDGTVWIATTRGLMKYREGQQTLYTTAHGLSDNQVADVSQDRDGGLWIGMWSSGACKLPGEMIVSFRDVKSFPNREVRKIIEDQQGRIYVGIVDSGLAEVVNGKLEPIAGSQAPPFNKINGRFLQGSLGDWWIGTEQGLFRFRGPRCRVLRGQKITPGGVGEVSQDATGRIWFGLGFGSQNSLCWVDPARQGPLVFQCAQLKELVAYHIVRDRSGTVWLGSQHHLARFVNGSVVALQQTDGLPETDPRAFFIDSRGWLWIGLRFKGVSMTKGPGDEDPKFVNYSTQNGLASDSVWSIAEDDLGRMYFGTGKGLDRLDLSTGRIRHFTTADGLAGDLVYDCVKDRGGNIWVATSTGLSRFNPRAERTVGGPPPIYLSRVQVAGEDLSLAQTGVQRLPAFELTASRNNLLVEYVGLDFHGEGALKYQYKLEGADADWSSQTDQRSVNYARLASGSYRFLVKAINQEGIESPEPAVVEFRILPHLWLRWWFLTIASIVVGASVYGAYRYRVARLIAIERVRTRIASDLHDDIGASLSRMAILSEVVKRQAGVAPDSLPILTEIADSARGLVCSMRDIVWSIDPRRDYLNSLVSRIRQFAYDVLEPRGVKSEFEVSPELGLIRLGPDARRHLFLIFKEAISNIGRHAQCSSVSIKVTLDHGWLRAQVRDDGRGFPPASQTSPADGGPGHGLGNMRARATQLGGELTVQSSPGMGTTLELIVPLRKL